MEMRRQNRFTRRFYTVDTDPLSGMANLFDLAMVFAVALMVAMVAHFQVADLLTEDRVTMVKNPGQPDMEIITKEGDEITRYTPADEPAGEGQGRRVGTAYELPSGQIIYVPED